MRNQVTNFFLSTYSLLTTKSAHTSERVNISCPNHSGTNVAVFIYIYKLHTYIIENQHIHSKEKLNFGKRLVDNIICVHS